MLDAKITTLLAVVEKQSFTKAAEALGLTQPAVSQHIRQLEEDLGIKLFNRADRSLGLTKEGEIAVKYARRIVQLYQNLKLAIKDSKKNIKHLTVGVSHTSESNMVSEVFAKYAKEHEGVNIRIISDDINTLYTRLKTYQIDLIVAEGRILDYNFNSILLDTDYLVLAVSNENPLSRRSVITLEELKKEKLILRLPNSGTRSLFEAHLESNNEDLDAFNVTIEVDNIATIKDLVIHDFGVSILPKSACLNEIRKKKLTVIPIENLSMTREINIVYHKDFEHMDILRGITSIYQKLSASRN